MRKIIILLLIATVLHSGHSETKKEEILIATASSLMDLMQTIGSEFEKKNKNIKILYSFGSSGILKSQIEKGAGVDLFAFASLTDGKYLENKNLIKKDSLRIICKNSLVLVINKKDKKFKFTNFDSLTSDRIKRIAAGNFETVPAGKYAKELLEELGLFEKVKYKFIFADNVRQALTYVELGNADAALIYKTDFMISKNLIVVSEKDKINGNEILYSAGIIKASENKNSVEKFMNYILSAKGKSIFEKYGFNTK